MSQQDVSYWLSEVKALQQQLSLLQQERDIAHEESARWRDRYQAESQLRQQNTAFLKEQIRQLEAEQAERQQLSESEGEDSTDLLESLADMRDLDEIQQYVQEIAQERNRLHRALEAERQAHSQTRESLSIALGDTIDLLTHRGPKRKAESPS